MIILPVLIWLKFFKNLRENIILLHRELLLYIKIALIFKLTNLNISFNLLKKKDFSIFKEKLQVSMCYGLNFFSFLLGKKLTFFFFFLFGEKPSSSLLSLFLCELPLIINQNTSLVTLPVTRCVWIFPTATSKHHSCVLTQF